MTTVQCSSNPVVSAVRQPNKKAYFQLQTKIYRLFFSPTVIFLSLCFDVFRMLCPLCYPSILKIYFIFILICWDCFRQFIPLQLFSVSGEHSVTFTGMCSLLDLWILNPAHGLDCIYINPFHGNEKSRNLRKRRTSLSRCHSAGRRMGDNLVSMREKPCEDTRVVPEVADPCARNHAKTTEWCRK